mgnify:CR=1 FL=1
MPKDRTTYRSNVTNDYSDDERWWLCIRQFARAQQDYPDGIGIERTLDILRKEASGKKMWELHPTILSRVVNKCRKTYIKLKGQHHESEKHL